MTEGTRTPSRTRRSYPNLHNLSLAPLSSKYPLDASAPPSPDDVAVHTPRTSYIAQKSAPSTPGILSLSQSRSNSRTRASRRAKPIYAYDGYFVNPDQTVRVEGDLPKAKSTSTLHHPAGVSFADQTSPVTADGRHHARKATAPLPLRMPMIRHHTSDASDEWIHRAGLAIAGETRDSKGQGWLVRRESSTSLVDDDDHPHPRQLLLSGESIDVDDYPTFSPRMSRTGSRLHSRMTSRVPSARQSRRGSRAGSRADLAMTSAGLGSAYASARHSLEIPEFDADDSRFAQPDFVEADDESSGDEEEVARLARERGFGLGGWMDRLIGWTLFSVDEDGEVSSSEDDEDESETMAYQAANMTKEEMRLRREVEAKRRKLEREAIIAASAVGGKDADAMQGGPVVDAAKPPEEGDGWQDAAWLLSVASKAMF